MEKQKYEKKEKQICRYFDVNSWFNICCLFGLAFMLERESDVCRFKNVQLYSVYVDINDCWLWFFDEGCIINKKEE